MPLLLGTVLALVCVSRAQTPSPGNPYNSQLRALNSALAKAPAPEAAVLLRRIYDLRDFVDQPEEITTAIQGIAGDANRHPLVRDEALRLLAAIDVHENRLDQARAKLARLGFVRQWKIAGPFTVSPGLDAQFGPEHSLINNNEFADGSSRRRWRTVPDFGPFPWVDLSDFYPQAGPAVAFAGTSVFSDSARTVALRFASDSAVALLVNGRQLFRADDEPGMGFDQHAVTAELHAGWNSILLKLYRTGQGPWRFALRISGLSGGGLPMTASAGEIVSPATASENALPLPDDLVTTARRQAEAEPSADNFETLARIERDHARGSALEHFEAAARRQPTADRWLLVARSCRESPCRLEALNAALRTEPGNTAAQLALADYYVSRRQLEKARDLLRAALERTPEDFVIRERLSELYASTGLNSLVLRECRRIETASPHPIWIQRQLAARYVELGLLDQAKALLDSALAHNWDGAAERDLLLQIYTRRRDAERLRAVYSAAMRLHPTDALPRVRLAQLDAGEDHLDSAKALMQAALEIAPEDDSLHREFAEMLGSSGQADSAHRELARALELNPQLVQVRQRLEATGAGAADPDSAYLVNAGELATEARRTATGQTAPDLPEQDPTANTIALADIRIEHVFDNGLSSVRTQQVLFVASVQGARELSTRSVQYTPDWQQLEVLKARIFKCDGRTVEAQDAGESAVADSNISMYYDVRGRSLRFPGLEPGDVLELDYRVSPAVRTNPYGDYFGDLVIFGATQPEKLKRFVLIAPAQRRFNVLEERMPAAAVQIVRDGRRTYVWEARDLPPLPTAPRSPAVSEIAPYVNVSTFVSWDDLGRWYAQLIQPQFALDRALRDALSRILAGKRTALEKIRAIHEFVLRNTHYVALEFGIYGYKPYPVSQTYARRFGDCKDKASLMIALLRAAGIDADIALVRTRRLGDINPNAASIAVFNHAVAYLPGYSLWLDGTAEYAGPRELPLEDQGAMALTVGADGHAQLRRIPVTTADENFTRRTVQARIQPDGIIQFSGTAYSRGEDAPGLRREYQVVERQRDAFRDHLAEIFPTVRLEDVEVDGANDLGHAVTVNFRGELDTFAGRASISLGASWLPRAYLQTLAPLVSRTQPLVLPAPWTTEEELHFALPAGARLDAIPADTALDTQFGSAHLRFEQHGREIVVRTSVQFRKLRIAPSEYAAFRAFCGEVERAFRGEVKIGL